MICIRSLYANFISCSSGCRGTADSWNSCYVYIYATLQCLVKCFLAAVRCSVYYRFSAHSSILHAADV